MFTSELAAKRIAALRKERGYTGEALAERLSVSPQAVSKWENAKCLPETAILPALAEALECSIDSLLCPRELFILEAVYTDGQTQVSVSRFLNDMVRDNTLNIYVNTAFIGADIESDRLKVLIVKFQTPGGIGYSYALQNENLTLDKKSTGFAGDRPFQIIGAFYGSEKDYVSAMQKMEHYEYFKWDRIEVNHETFPSNPASDDTEYLTLIYLNAEGIHVISCAENDTIYYVHDGMQLLLRDDSKCILENVMHLSWDEGMKYHRQTCPWAGSFLAALNYMGEAYTYEQIMGMSGACYRIAFTDAWDYSCTDALVAFDYAAPLYSAVGYAFRTVERLEKQKRKAERQAIMKDIQSGKPVLAINLRVAPEWGIITGYTHNGARFLCRTYFDQEAFGALEQADRQMVFEENGGYLYADFWPFIIMHFGEKKEKPSPQESLRTSLTVLRDSFHARKNRGYYQGKEAYRAWMEGLSKESDFQLENDRENVMRRLSVNDNMLCSLIDSRQAAAVWLRENLSLLAETAQKHLEKMAENFRTIAEALSAFRCRACQSLLSEAADSMADVSGVSTKELRREQMHLLENALLLEEENYGIAETILELQER